MVFSIVKKVKYQILYYCFLSDVHFLLYRCTYVHMCVEASGVFLGCSPLLSFLDRFLTELGAHRI